MRKRKVIALIAAGLLGVFCLVSGSCKAGEDGASDMGAPQSLAKLEYAEIKHLVGSNEGIPAKITIAINEYTQENYNIGYKLVSIHDEPMEEQVMLQIAAGENYDLFSVNQEWMNLWLCEKDEYFLALDDLLPAYAPRVWQSTPVAAWKACRFQGKIYYVPQTQDYFDVYGIAYRGDWAEDSGMSLLTSVRDFGGYFRYCRDRNAYGCDSGTPQWLWLAYLFEETGFQSWNGISGGLGTCSGIAADFSDIYAMPESEDYFRLLQGWTDSGCSYRDSEFSDTVNPMLTGSIGACSMNIDDYMELAGDMEEAFPGSDLQFFNCSGESLKIGGYGIAVSAKTQYPAQAVVMLDALCTDSPLNCAVTYRTRPGLIPEKGTGSGNSCYLGICNSE